MSDFLSISSGIFPFLIIIYSIILHEIAHGYAAYVQGDQTAYRAQRLTLNPLPHVDVMGSVIVPLFAFLTAGTFFGWAKPVPYNPYNIRTDLGRAFIASAGILTNLLIALVTGIVFKVLYAGGSLTPELGKAIYTVISVNVSLAFFNLIPIPPFDGMAILEGLFPRIAIHNRIVYNPLYMIVAIIAASVLYDMFMPHLFSIVNSMLI